MSAPHSRDIPDHRRVATFADFGTGGHIPAEWVNARGNNLVPNGTGLLGDATGWIETNTEFVPEDAPPGSRGSFRLNRQHGQILLRAPLPINPANRYAIQFWARNRGSAAGRSLLYSLFAPMDAYGQNISPPDHYYHPHTTTELTQDLKPGDTVAHVASVEGWPVTGSLLAWNYVDPGGKPWPEGTLSRNRAVRERDGVDADALTIRLAAPWPASNGTAVAGTRVSNSIAAGTYIYPNSSLQPGDEWTLYTAVMEDRIARPGEAFGPGTGWPPGTAQARFGFLLNYPPNDDNADHLVGGIEVSAMDLPRPQTGETARRPVNPRAGMQYFDTNIGRPIWWDGGKWINASGGTV